MQFVFSKLLNHAIVCMCYLLPTFLVHTGIFTRFVSKFKPRSSGSPTKAKPSLKVDNSSAAVASSLSQKGMI